MLLYTVVSCGLICIFLMANDVEHLFHVLIDQLYIFFREMSFIPTFKNGLYFLIEL